VHRIASNIKHAEWFTSWQDSRPEDAEWVEATKNGGIQTWAKSNNYDLAFIGLRAEESSRRALYLRNMGTCHFVVPLKIWQCNPLAWWTVKDIWAYILSTGIEYNRAYDKLSELDVPLDRQRVGPLAVERVLGYGQLALLKRGWPDLYNRFKQKYPEAGQFV